MADVKEYVLTPDGKAQLEEELNRLVTVTRKEVSAKIKEARSFGDLSENAEYDAAKDEQARVESRINTITNMLKYAKVIDADSGDSVTVGKIVTVSFHGATAEMMGMSGEQTYNIVGTTEADPAANKLSYESPIGAACLNKSVGDNADVETPAGIVSLTILKIERA